MEKKQIVFQEIMERGKAAEYLELMIKDLRDGKFVVEGDGDSMTLEPEETVRLEVEAKQKKGREKLEIELTWPAEGAGEEQEEEEEGSSKEKADSMERSLAQSQLGKIIPVAVGIGAASILGMLLIIRKKGKAKKVLDMGKEEAVKLLKEGEELIADGEAIMERGGEEARKLLWKAGKRILT